ncbi:MAG: hypothetical protein ABIW31_05735 [Novosphingobium sp.]
MTDFVPGIVMLGAGLFGLFFAKRAHAFMWSRRNKRLNEIENGKPEAFFEEKRSLETYKPPAKVGTVWLWGLFATVFGGYTIYSWCIRYL